jgi:hypothetical protein
LRPFFFTRIPSFLPYPPGRATAAIDVGKKVLAAFPEYPKIKEEVINKARSLLRM